MAKSHLVKDLGNGTGEYSNGDIRYLKGNPQGKHVGSKVGGGVLAKHQFNSETGKAAALKRIEDRRLAAEEGAIEAIREGMNIDCRTAIMAAKYIYKAQAELATSPDSGRASTEAAKMVLAGMDMYGDRRGRSDVPAVIVKIDNATFSALQAVDDYEEDNIIDVEAEEVPF